MKLKRRRKKEKARRVFSRLLSTNFSLLPSPFFSSFFMVFPCKTGKFAFLHKASFYCRNSLKNKS
jgi:hypothetical protein